MDRRGGGGPGAAAVGWLWTEVDVAVRCPGVVEVIKGSAVDRPWSGDPGGVTLALAPPASRLSSADEAGEDRASD